MGDDDKNAFFPSPRAKGSYREPAERTLTVHDPALEENPKQAIVKRPSTPDDSGPVVAKKPPARIDVEALAEDERVYWGRGNFFKRHPRIAGALLTVIGGYSTYEDMSTLLYGGTFFRSAFLGPILLAAGIFPLIFGFPEDKNEPGTNPRWWKIGYGTVFGVGLIWGLVLLTLLLKHTTAIHL